MRKVFVKIRHYGLMKSAKLVMPFICRELNLKLRKRAFPKFAVETLLKLSNTLKQNNLEHWLEYGTLLGLVRDSKLIQHDLDLDVGVFTPQDSTLYRRILASAGFKLIKVWYLDGVVIEETYSYKNVHVDLYYFQKVGDKLIAYTCYRQRTIDNNLKFNQYNVLRYSYVGYMDNVLLDVLGHKFFIPRNYEQLLEQKYGNWRVKNSAWTIFDSPVVENISGLAILKTV